VFRRDAVDRRGAHESERSTRRFHVDSRLRGNSKVSDFVRVCGASPDFDFLRINLILLALLCVD
jgi:hypothetical protein